MSEREQPAWLTGEHTKEYLICRADRTLIAFRADEIEEVRPCRRITYIPGCPDAVLGVIHLHGKLESVLDARLLLGLRQKELSESSRILMTSDPQRRTGMVFDEIKDIAEINPDSVSSETSSLPPQLRELADGLFFYRESQVIVLRTQTLWKTALGEEDGAV